MQFQLPRKHQENIIESLDMSDPMTAVKRAMQLGHTGTRLDSLIDIEFAKVPQHHQIETAESYNL